MVFGSDWFCQESKSSMGCFIWRELYFSGMMVTNNLVTNNILTWCKNTHAEHRRKQKIIMLITFTQFDSKLMEFLPNHYPCLLQSVFFGITLNCMMSESQEQNGGLHTETFDKNKVTTSHFPLVSSPFLHWLVFLLLSGNCKIAFN